MGKRSTQTTKSGKYMNPTDQARKEARKKELRKNKKQRQTVRHAVLKSKDPLQIFKELDGVDDMEFDPINAPKLNEKVLKEKRRKLKETLKRVMGMYEKENPNYYFELRKAESEYERRKVEKQIYYEQVQTAKRCTIDQIPLPENKIGGGIPLPPMTASLPPPKIGILKKSAETANKFPLPKRKPPGPPPGTPPIISDTDDSDSDDPFQPPIPKKRVIRFDDPGDGEEKDTRLTMSAAYELSNQMDSYEDDGPPGVRDLSQQKPAPVVLPPGPPPGLPTFLMRAQTGMNIRHPNPPPQMPHQFRPPGPTVRLPPGPPPGLPPHLMNRPAAQQQNMNRNPQQKLDNRRSQSGPTIEAKPQIKNIMGDVTRFTPMALKVRREVKDNRGRVIKTGQNDPLLGSSDKPLVGPTKDKVYDSFMSELKGLL
ncbi:DgyrCDS7401 [Dimorphilus gyrociliatus]|uniref:DgyrCDS7401 n=1 Tax=Dimorphilus gyrociliatus TaxID=2664684 RepID=A0A7I8VR45_9ANNE|nr:DgyrCDS7401 [Dimorphilus gyrociliatus]